MKKNYIVTFLLVLELCTFKLQAARSLSPDVPATIHNTTSPIPHDTCLNKKFSVVFYLMQDSMNLLPATINTYSLSGIINVLNTTFARLCVSFEHCKTVIIPNYSYNKWTAGTTDSIVMADWYTPQTLNIYLPTGLLLNTNAPDLYEYASPYPGAGGVPRDYIVMRRLMVGQIPAYLLPNSTGLVGADIMHVAGHFFGLLHTYAESSTLPVLPDGPSTELVNDFTTCPAQPNPAHGDGICDTEADCYPTGFNTNMNPNPTNPILCNFNYQTGAQDAAGNYYTPPTDNLMSAYDCRCRFTQEQYNRMAKNILTTRLYLR